MRAHWILAVTILTGCASEKLALAPPAGVDLSGHWKLNVADSDDPVRLSQMRNMPGAMGSGGAAGGSGGSGGGRRGRGGQSGGAGGPSQAGAGPSIPPVASFAEVLQWPGVDLSIRQSSGAAVFTSDGAEHVYRPAPPSKKGSGEPRQLVGWDGKSLVIEMQADADRPPLTERFQVSADGNRLIQEVSVKGGRSNGFAMSRVWDRLP
jgi:hypothetical protein